MGYQETSREAYESVNHESLDGGILRTLKEAGQRGCTCQEIEKALDRSHQAVSGNLSHLSDDGTAIRTVEKRKFESGREGFVYVHPNCLHLVQVHVVVKPRVRKSYKPKKAVGSNKQESLFT